MAFSINRRRALATIGLGGLGGVAGCTAQPNKKTFTATTQSARGVFAHGVASGDPLSDRVILWTRVTPANPNGGAITVTWEMSEDISFETVVATGDVQTQAARDWTVKVDATGLTPGREYFYRFSTDIYTSAHGRTRTLPVGEVPKARFAVVSCSNWQHGFFNAYDHIARQDHFDALLHLGDYIYEYGADKVLGTEHSTLGRLHEPRHEILSLSDYRTRHAQYRTDPSLQAVTAKMPMIAIWDDHESANDSWIDGAENHNTDDGDWTERKQNALRAYYEWMPVRDPEPGRAQEALFRAFEWGDLLSLAALETRLFARGEPVIIDDYFDMLREEGGPERFNTEILNAPGRDMLGDVQMNFVLETLKASKAAKKPWRILANQVVMGQLMTPDLKPYVDEASMVSIEKQWDGIRNFVELSGYGLPVYPDSWDGYPVARENFFTALSTHNITDVLVLTGDAHEFWVNELQTKNSGNIGVEIGTTSVSSETLGAFLGDATEDYALLMTQTNADVRYYNPLHHGYTDLAVSRDRAQVKMIAVDTVKSRDYGAFTVAEFTIRPTRSRLKVSNPKGLNMKQRALFSGLG